MPIEAAPLDRHTKIIESPHEAVTPLALGNAIVANAPSESAAPVPVSPSAVAAAVQQLQAAISTSANPDFTLDYLSGLSVVTVRSTITGEVVFQLPDTRALELARMIKDGASVGSVGLFSTTA